MYAGGDSAGIAIVIVALLLLGVVLYVLRKRGKCKQCQTNTAV